MGKQTDNGRYNVGSLRVLMMGAGHDYHLEPLARCIREADPSVKLEVHGLRKSVYFESNDKVLDSSVYFDRIYAPVFNRHRKTYNLSKRRGGSSIESDRGREILQQGSLFWMWLRTGKKLYRICRKAKKVSRDLDGLQDGVDVLHLQSIFKTNPMVWAAVGELRKPLVVSCFGSDVFRKSDPELTLLHRLVLDRASAIVVCTTEFGEILLAKYGRHLSPKIHYAFFNPEVDAYVAQDQTAAKAQLAKIYPDFLGRKVVCLGHNAYPENQHLSLIGSLGKMPDSLKSKLFVWVPMTYGGSASYIDEVRQALIDHSLESVVSDSYLSTDVLRLWRSASDILLYAPISDAFSATVSQALAAGSVGILGSWLPYKLRRRMGFSYKEIDYPEEAGVALESILANWDSWAVRCLKNRKLSGDIFSTKRIGVDWINIYRSVSVR